MSPMPENSALMEVWNCFPGLSDTDIGKLKQGTKTMLLTNNLINQSLRISHRRTILDLIPGLVSKMPETFRQAYQLTTDDYNEALYLAVLIVRASMKQPSSGYIADGSILIHNFTDPHHTALFQASQFLENYITPDVYLPVHRLSYTKWTNALQKQCNFDPDKHRLRYNTTSNGCEVAINIFIQEQWASALLQMAAGQIAFEIVPILDPAKREGSPLGSPPPKRLR